MSRQITANGLTFNIEERLPEQPTGQTLVLLHGFTGSAAAWGDHLAAFARSGMRVIALDLHGHGATDAPADPARYALERCREDIVAVLQALGVAPGEAILLGYSMGGRIALGAALSGFFRALILESASPGLRTDAERADRRASDEALAERIEREGVPAFVAYWENIPLFASQRDLPDTVRDRQHQQRLANRPVGLANSLRGVGTGAQPSLWGKLPELRIPTLLITGALDVKFTASAREMVAQLPNAHLRVIPHAGHTAHLEAPSAFDALVIAFCQSLTETPQLDTENTETKLDRESRDDEIAKAAKCSDYSVGAGP